jgi:hypothetical protein
MSPIPPIVTNLGLAPHPEGGWYRRYFTSGTIVEHPVASTSRPAATLIHYLLLVLQS